MGHEDSGNFSFMVVSIKLFHLLNLYYVLGTVLGVGDAFGEGKDWFGYK